MAVTRISGPTRIQLDQAADQYAALLDRELAFTIQRTVAWFGDQFTADDLGVIPQFWADRLDGLLAPTLALALHAGSADIRRQLRQHLGSTVGDGRGFEPRRPVTAPSTTPTRIRTVQPDTRQDNLTAATTLEAICPACGIERADVESIDDSWYLPDCPNCSAEDPPVLTAAAWNGVPVTSQQLADAYLATARNRLVGVGDLTWQLAREQLLEGQQAGESIAQLRDRVASATGLASPRAGVIARTEILDALNYGAHAEMAATGLDGTKEWLATGDSRTREDHVHADGQKVGVKDKFTVGGWPMDRPHDPIAPVDQVVNCRCALTFEVDLDDVSVEPAQPAQEQAQAQADHQVLGAVWVADAIRRGVTADDLAALLSLTPFLPDEEQSAAETAAAVTIPEAGSQEGASVPWEARKHPDCSGYAVVNSDTGKVVDGGCHKTKKDAEAHSRALWANAGDEHAVLGDLLHFAAKVDGTAWDANAAMSSCGDAACYRAICAGRKAGPPDQRGSWALPHHKSAGGPPNAAGVRAALSRFSSTQGLQNAGAARAHLDAHMATIRNQSEEASVSATTTEEQAHTSVDFDQATSQGTDAVEELADKSKGHCPPGKTWNPALGRCVSPKKPKMGAEVAAEGLSRDLESPEAAEEGETLGGDPNPGTDKDKRLTENKDKAKKKRRTSAATDSKIEPTGEGRFEAILVVEGIPTGDGREFAPDSLSFADFPLPLTYQPPTHGGEPGPAVDVGVIEEGWRDEDNPRLIRGRGRFDMADPAAADIYRKVEEKLLRGTSVDIDDIDPYTDVELVWPESAELSDDGEEDDSGDISKLFMPPSKRIFHKGRIRGAAVLSMPAFVEAQLWAEGADPPELPDLEQVEQAARAEQEAQEQKEHEAVTAAAIVTRLDEFRPKAEWFQNPRLGQRCPITATDELQVYGHAWRRGECHIGYGGECVTPPEEDDFPFFATGEVLCAGGERIAVGQITIGTGHAPLRLGQRAAAEHYDNTGSVVADVAIGMDEIGAWVAGAIRPGATPQQVYALRASGQVSGDWRSIGGRLRLVALLGVNVPGFPVPRAEARVAGGQVQALVAAGMLDVGPKVDWEAEIEQRALRSMRDRALAAFGDD